MLRAARNDGPVNARGRSCQLVDQVIRPYRLRAISALEESFSLYYCANGKAILTSLPPVQQTQVLPSLFIRFTTNTSTTWVVLHKERDRIRVEGVAYGREVQSEGICAMGVAPQKATGQMVAVSVPVPTQRFYG